MRNIIRTLVIGVLATLCIIGIALFGNLLKRENVEGISCEEAGVLWYTLTGCEWPKDGNCENEVSWGDVQNAIAHIKNEWQIYFEDDQSEPHKCVQKLKEKYQAEDKIARDDWYGFYQILCTFFMSKVHTEVGVSKVVVLEKLEQNKYFTNVGELVKETAYELEVYHNYWIVTSKKKIIAVWKECEEDIVLKNVLVENEDSDGVHFFYHGKNIHIEYKGIEQQLNHLEKKVMEQNERAYGRIGDVVFAQGKMSDINLKENIVSGKVIQRETDTLTLGEEESCQYSLEPDVEIYQTYGELKSLTVEDIPIGYEYADFVLEGGKIVAVLLTRDNSMQSIRVLLNDAVDGDFFYDKFKVKSDMDYLVIQDSEITQYAGGESYQVESDNLDIEDRVLIKPAANSGTIKCMSMQRSQGIPEYRGHIEIVCTEKGLVVVNEVLLEDYLYSVVPSEMPASYPMEALKAQAICARTYAYNKMLHALYPQWGAHLDDTTTCQVYNNQMEQVETNQAVRETFGMIVEKENVPIDTFYYSTSCGCGTTEEIWGNGKKYDYLYAKEISVSGDDKEKEDSAISMIDEHSFEEFIRMGNENDFECEEPWYRWSYHGKVDKEALLKRLRQIYEQSPNKVQVWNETKQQYESTDLPKLKELNELQIITRLAGGVVNELVIQTGVYKIKVITEQLIRTLLPEPDSEILRWDGSKVPLTGILPSAFIYLDTEKNEQGEIVELMINGGGFGHGVGMSQNAAKHMAIDGMNMAEILSFFYKDTQINSIYKTGA